MISVAPVSSNDAINYHYVATDRMRNGDSRPLALTALVLKAYSDYEHQLVTLCGSGAIPHFDMSDNEKLKENAAYLSRVYFDDLRGQILASAPVQKCPYCYQRKASQIDHFLPKARFGEYSIFTPNLVPICGECNLRKLNRYARADGGRRYFHPYFDDASSNATKILAVEISLASTIGVNFHLVRPIGMSDEIWKILECQFSDLRLRVSYMEDAVQTLMSMLGSLYAHFALGGSAELRKQLRIEANSRQSWYGINHWWPVLLDALAASNDFCNGGFSVLGPEPDY